MSSARTQRALWLKEQFNAVVTDSWPYPTISADEIIVKVKAVTLNPTDWKHIDGWNEPGRATGCDFAGDVVEVGANVQDVKVGDAVAGFLHGGWGEEKYNGSFQEYLKIRHELVWHKPASLSYEDAASMGGIALATAAQALILSLGLPKPWEGRAKTDSKPAPLIIWAGSTSVGLFAIALAKILDPSVPIITSASPHNFDLVKSRGADVVFDYRDPEVSAKIAQWAEENGYGAIERAFDCVSEGGSPDVIASAMLKGGKIITLLPTTPADSDRSVGKVVPLFAPPSGVEAKYPNNVEVQVNIVYDLLDPTSTEAFSFASEWNRNLPILIEKQGFYNAVPLKSMPGGLDRILEGLDLLRKGKVSGSKIAYTFY